MTLQNMAIVYERDCGLIQRILASSVLTILTWDQHFNGWQRGAGVERYYQVEPASKGKYRIDGFAGLARCSDSPENPQRFFEYVLPSGTLVSAVLKTPA